MIEYETPAEPTQETLLLTKDLPQLPDAVLKRFPDMLEYAEEWTNWWKRNRRILIEAHGETAAPVNQLATEVQSLSESISLQSGDFTAAINVERLLRIDADGALASLITTVSVAYVAADAILAASVTTEMTARVTADSALASSITTVIANYTSADAAISASVVTESTARSSADAALASSITTVIANYTAADATIAASVVTEATARSSADSALASSITTVIANFTAADTTLQSNINTANAAIVTEATARAAADSAEATTRSSADATLTTNLATVSAAVTTETSARVTADGALSSSISSVIASYIAADSTISASVTTEATARATADGLIHARWGVNLDINGDVAGFIHLDGTSASSSFTIAVDKFVITSPNGDITAFDIKPGGNIVFGADAQSDNYSPGAAGWKIERNSGNVEFNDGTFRGSINIDDDSAVRIAASTFQNFAGTTEGIGLELAYYRTVAADTWIDFHSEFPGTDYEARIIRSSGANGNLEIENTGTGSLILNGNLQFGAWTSDPIYTVDSDLISDGYFTIRDNGGTPHRVRTLY